jgi:nucleoside-diphosphate-sugar epimerase
VKAFVTGATGFVGGHLVAALRAAGAEVTALVRSPDRAAALAAGGVRLVPGALDDAEALARAVEGHDAVYHVAGLVAARSEAEFLAVNRDGTARLVAAAERAGTGRLVLVSSLAAAGPSAPGQPLRGDEPPRPVTRYGRSKLAAEAVVRQSGLDWTIVRPPAVYGPADREMYRVFRAASFGVAPVFGDGSLELSLVFAPDLAGALIAAAGAPAARGRVLYAAHPERLTSRDLVERVGRAAGRRVLVIGVPRPVAWGVLAASDATARLLGRATVLNLDKAGEFFQAAWTCDPAPLTEATGWTAEHDLDRGAAATLAWYRDAGWL